MSSHSAPTTTSPASATSEPIETAPRDGRWIIGIYDDPYIGEDVIGWRQERYCIIGAPQGAFGPGWVGRDCDELPVDTPERWRPMPVYVDEPIFAWRGKKWCHLFCEDEPTLHEFAQRLGLLRGWFQKPPKASWKHYDITAAKRMQAIRLGAISVDKYEALIVSRRMEGRLTSKVCEMVEKARTVPR